MVAGMHLQHTGTFNMGESTDQWKPFTSDQKVITPSGRLRLKRARRDSAGPSRAGARSYTEGEGTLHASLLGLFTVVDMQGTGDVARVS